MNKEKKLVEGTSLRELTGAGGGIVILPNEQVGVYDWTASCITGELPIVANGAFVTGMMCGHRFCATVEHVKDIREVLPGTVWADRFDENTVMLDTDINIVWDPTHFIAGLFLEDMLCWKNPCMHESMTDYTYAGDVYRVADEGDYPEAEPLRDIIVIVPDRWVIRWNKEQDPKEKEKA